MIVKKFVKSSLSKYLFVISRIPIGIKQNKSISSYEVKATTTSLAAQKKRKLVLQDDEV